MVGFMDEATETVNVLVDVPSAVPPEYVVRVAVAVALVAPDRWGYHVSGIVNVADDEFAGAFTVTVGACPVAIVST